jgi:hypothetical protein
MARISASNAKRPTLKEQMTLPKVRKTTCKHENVKNKRLPERHAAKRHKEQHSRRFTDHSKDLKNYRSLNKRI